MIQRFENSGGFNSAISAAFDGDDLGEAHIALGVCRENPNFIDAFSEVGLEAPIRGASRQFDLAHTEAIRDIFDPTCVTGGAFESDHGCLGGFHEFPESEDRLDGLHDRRGCREADDAVV
jgi:hypothetical protein